MGIVTTNDVNNNLLVTSTTQTTNRYWILNKIEGEKKLRKPLPIFVETNIIH